MHLGTLNPWRFRRAMQRWFGSIVRFTVTSLILIFVTYAVPSIVSLSAYNAIFVGFITALLGWICERISGFDLSPYKRGIIGFIVSSFVIYFAGYFLMDDRITIPGALLSAFVIGIVDMFVPDYIVSRADR
jgi:putative membrane protein